MNLNLLAVSVLPRSLYHRLAGSSVAKRLARGSFWAILGSTTSRLIMLVAMIFVARVLGQESFGEFGLIQQTLGVVGLLAGLGLGGTATRFVAHYAVVDPPRAGRVIALVTVVSVGTVGLSAGAMIVASEFIASTMFQAQNLQTALIWGSLLMAAMMLRGVQDGVLAGFEKFDAIAKLNILQGVFGSIAMVFLARSWGVEGAVLGLALSSILVCLLGRVLLNGVLDHRTISVCYRNCWSEWRVLTEYTFPSFMAAVAAAPVLWYAMTLLARSEQGFSGLALFNAAYQWHGPMVFIPMVLMSVTLPVLVQEWEAGNRYRFRKVTFWNCGLVLAISLPPASMAAFMSPWIMELYGPGFRDGWIVLILLLAAAPLHGISKISSSALLAMNKAWWVLGANLAWGATLLTITVSALPSDGVMNLATAFLTAYGVLAALSLGLVLVGSRSNYHSARAAGSQTTG